MKSEVEMAAERTFALHSQFLQQGFSPDAAIQMTQAAATLWLAMRIDAVNLTIASRAVPVYEITNPKSLG